MTSSDQLKKERREQLMRMESLCDRFEDLCQSSSPANLEEFLAEHSDFLTPEVVTELIQIDLGYQLETGDLPVVDVYADGLQPYEDIARKVHESLTGKTGVSSSLEFGEAVYEVHEQIGAGGMAQIFRGFDRRLNRSVAIKKLRSELVTMKSAIDRFQNEAKIVAAIRHDGIVRVFDVGIQNGELFIVFELLEGGTLADKVADGPLSAREAATYVRHLAETMHEAHRAGIIHLDLKPSNVLVTQSGELKITDFGLATLRNDESIVSTTNGLSGTVNYMAPEQALARTDHFDRRTDVYGLGAILYELLTGQPPCLGATSLETVDQLIYHRPTPPCERNPAVPQDLEQICLKCLEKDTDFRYESSLALANDLTNFLAGRPTVANPVGPFGRATKWCLRNRAMVGICAVAFALILFVSVASLFRILDERKRFLEQRDAAIASLYDSLIGEARAIRLGESNGFRVAAWEKIKAAIDLGYPGIDRAELRNEVVAGMGNFVGQTPVTWNLEHPSRLFVATAIHPDNQLIAIGLLDGSISIREIDEGKELARLQGHRTGVFEIVFSNDGRRLATADDTGEIRVWVRHESADWRPESVLPGPRSHRPGYVKAVSLAFSKNGDWLFSCPFGGTEIQRWRLGDKTHVAEVEFVSENPIVRFSLSNDSKTIVVGTAENEILLWDRVNRGIESRYNLQGDHPILDVVFSPDDRVIAAGTMNGVHVFDLQEQRRIMSLPGDHLITLSFGPDSRILALPSEDLNLVRLWDVKANREVAVLENDAYEATFSSDGKWLVCVAATQITTWNLRDQSSMIMVRGHDTGVLRTGFLKDSQSLQSVDSDGIWKTWSLDTPTTPIDSWKADRRISSINNDLDLIVAFDERQFELHQLPLNPQTPPVLSFQHDLGNRIWNGQFTDSGNHFIAAGNGGVTRWPVKHASDDEGYRSIELGAAEKLFTERAGSICVSTDSKLIAWVGYDSAVHVRDLHRGRTLQTDGLTASIPNGIAFIPGTHRLIMAPPKGPVRLRDFAREASEPRMLFDKWPTAEQNWQKVQVAVDQRGQKLCIQRGNLVSVWDLNTFQQIVSLPPSHELVWSVTWNADASRIALGYANGNLVVWDLIAVNRQLQPFGLSWED